MTFKFCIGHAIVTDKQCVRVKAKRVLSAVLAADILFIENMHFIPP